LIDRRRPEGIFINPFERGEIGSRFFPGRLPDGFSGSGVEAPGPPVSGRPVETLVKVKNRAHPAMERVMEAFR